MNNVYRVKRAESVERLALIFCPLFAVRKIIKQFMQLFKKNSKTIFTKNKARANITHNPELSGLFLKGGMEKCY